MKNISTAAPSRFVRRRQKLLTNLAEFLAQFNEEQQSYSSLEPASPLLKLATEVKHLTWLAIFPEFAKFCSPVYFAAHGYNGISEFASRVYQIPNWHTAVAEERAKIFRQVQNKLLRELIYLQDWYDFEGKILEQNLLSLNYPSEIILLRRLQLLLSFLPLKLQTEYQILQLEAKRDDLLQTPIEKLEEFALRLLTRPELEALVSKMVSPLLYLQLEQEILSQILSGQLPQHYLLAAYSKEFIRLDKIKVSTREQFREQREAAELNAYIAQINEDHWQLSSEAEAKLQGYANYLLQQLHINQSQFNKQLLAQQPRLVQQWLDLDTKLASQFSSGLRNLAPRLQQVGFPLTWQNLSRINFAQLLHVGLGDEAEKFTEELNSPLTPEIIATLLEQTNCILPIPTWQLPTLLDLTKSEKPTANSNSVKIGKTYDISSLVTALNTLPTSDFGALVQEVANLYDEEEYQYPTHLISLLATCNELVTPSSKEQQEEKEFSLRLGFGHGLLENDPKPTAVEQYSKQERELKTKFYPILYQLEQQQQLQDSYSKVLFLELIKLQEQLNLDLNSLLSNPNLNHSHWQFQWLALQALISLKELIEQDNSLNSNLSRTQIKSFSPREPQELEHHFNAKTTSSRTGQKGNSPVHQQEQAGTTNLSSLSETTTAKSTSKAETRLSIRELISSLASESQQRFLQGLNWSLINSNLNTLEHKLLLNSNPAEIEFEQLTPEPEVKVEPKSENPFFNFYSILEDLTSSRSQPNASSEANLKELTRKRTELAQLNAANILALQQLILVPEFRLYDFVSLILEHLAADTKSALAFYASLTQLVESEEQAENSASAEATTILGEEILTDSALEPKVIVTTREIPGYAESAITEKNLPNRDIRKTTQDRQHLNSEVILQNLKRIQAIPSLAVRDIDLASIPLPEDETDPRVWLASNNKTENSNAQGSLSIKTGEENTRVSQQKRSKGNKTAKTKAATQTKEAYAYRSQKEISATNSDASIQAERKSATDLSLAQRVLSKTELSEEQFFTLQEEIQELFAQLTAEQQELYTLLSSEEPIGNQYRNPDLLPALNISPLYYQQITNNKEEKFSQPSLESLQKLDWLGILDLKAEFSFPKFQGRQKYHLLKPLLQKSSVLVDDIRFADLTNLQPTAERVILHCDLNNCFATIEAKLNPSLRGRVFAVTGNPKERHGIILAKSEEAKRFKVATAETIAQAKKKCPHLLCVPPHHGIYKIHSQLVFKIYQEYSPYIETVSLDEAWIDITDAIQQRQQSALSIAHEIRERIQRELQLTVSIGVSFNKTLAKLGSDLKKPNAVTEISPYSFKPLLAQTPIEDLIGIGRKTIPKLKKLNINYIYDISYFSLKEYLEIFGSHGIFIWLKGNGLNFERVRNYSEPQLEKSISHGHTAKQDLTTKAEVKALIYNLSHKIAYRLIKGQIFATGVGIQIKTQDFLVSGMQMKLEIPTYSALEIAQAAYQLFEEHFNLERGIRLITVRTFDLVPAQFAMQVNFLLDNEKHQRLLALEQAIYFLNKKYQQEKVRFAIEFTTDKI